MFLEKIEEVPFDDALLKDRLMGEVHFLNAYFYHNLVRLYGGVPLVKKAYELQDEFLIARSSLQKASSTLLMNVIWLLRFCLTTYAAGGGDIGRATKGAALALKSRILLYAASELYNNPSWAGGLCTPGTDF